MKRFSLIFLSALAILMASCSKDGPQLPPEDAWVNDLSLPVPIQFGSGFSQDLVTKVGYESIEDFDESVIFGIFGLDTDSTDWRPDAPGVLLYNTSAQFNDGKIGFRYNKQVVTYYYPMEVSCNYTFYAYHTRSGNVEHKVDEDGNDGYYAPITFGSDDVLWAKTSVSDDMETAVGRDGFNSAYCRAVRQKGLEQQTHMPNLKFEHLTAALEFYAVGDNTDDTNLTDEDFSTVTVKKISITNAVSGATLCIAHENPANEKTWSDPQPEDTTVMSGVATAGVHPTVGDGTLVGDGLFLYPQDTYDVEIVINSPKLNGKGDSVLKRSVTADGGFKAGHKYRFDIMLKSPEVMDIIVTPTEFTDGTETITGGNVFDENNAE